MPLYSDSNYYYSGGSSQLYSPYYSPGLYSTPTSSAAGSSGGYSPYTSSYNRSMGGSYMVPLTPSRSTPTFTSSHALPSRYKPNLSTITETLPLMGSARHGMTPLTRIQSPKYNSYSSPSTSTAYVPKYVPPRPILINTADIDVSSNSRFRKHKEEEEAIKREAAKKAAEEKASDTSPNSSLKRLSETEANKETAPENLVGTEQSAERKGARSTIKRNRAVVRLSTIRSRSKDRTAKATSNEQTFLMCEPTEKKFKELPEITVTEEKLTWRQKLADDLAAIPTYPLKKSPGDKIRERYLIQDSKSDESETITTRKPRPEEQPIEEVVIEIDPLHHTIRRLSIPQCPTFHEICEDISSDKIDDDLNAGDLRRRASLIQEKEQELLNQLQNSPSGTFQLIHLERQDSHDSLPDDSRKSATKRKSKRGSKKLRHKITAIVDVENSTLTPIIHESEEDQLRSPKPKFTFNVDAVEEHHEIQKIFKLPKKKGNKNSAKTKDEVLPEGFVQAVPKNKTPPKAKPIAKKESFVSTAQIFTFDDAQLKNQVTEQLVSLKSEEQQITFGEQTPQMLKSDFELNLPKTTKPMMRTELTKILETPGISKTVMTMAGDVVLESPKIIVLEKLENSKQEADAIKFSEPPEPIVLEIPKEAETQENHKNLQMTDIIVMNQTKIDGENKASTSCSPSLKPPKPLEKQQSLNIEVPKATALKKSVAKIANKAILESSVSLDSSNVKPLEPTMKHFETLPSLNAVDESSVLGTSEKCRQSSESSDDFWTQIADNEEKDTSKTSKTAKNEVETITKHTKLDVKPLIKTAVSLEAKSVAPTVLLTQQLEKSQSLNIDEAQGSVATPKPIRKFIQKSNSGEDFWTQIGSRETLYMTNRKKIVLEDQWQKREQLLESQNSEEVKNLAEIKHLVTAQKEKALKQANVHMKSDEKKATERTHSNESSLMEKTKTETKTNEEVIKPKIENDNEFKSIKNKISPTKKSSPLKTQTKMQQEQLKLQSAANTKVASDTKPKTASPAIKPLATITLATAVPQQSAINTLTKITTATNTTPKINTGQVAKSPEEQKQKFATTTPEVVAATKTTTTLSTAQTASSEIPTAAAKTVAVAIITDKLKAEKLLAATSTTAKVQAEIKTVKQPEAVKKPSPQKTATAATTSDRTKPKIAAGKAKSSPSAKTSPSSAAAINADQFVSFATPKVASPTANKPKTATANASSSAATAATGKQQKSTMPTTITIASTPATKTTIATTASKLTTLITDTAAAECAKTITTASAATTAVAQPAAPIKTDISNDSDTRGGNNLSKFATVSNLAQCLQDVDAELEDYIPSSAENSESDSSSNYSSVDGCENLSVSMKKKLKQRRKKEKAAEKARFDPQKKVKIDTTNKCYVNDEPLRHPLVATPRPLWKREKIVYPPNSEDDSDSDEEDGSGEEETEDSEECSTTSEEYDDELNASATASPAGTAIGASGDAKDANSAIIRMSTCSNDSGFEGGTAPSSPKKMLGAQEARESPSTPPSTNPAYTIDANEENDETSYTYSQFQKSGRFTPPATIIPRFKTYSVDDFHFLAVLGKGSFGKVLLAELRNTEYYYAVKCLKKDVVLEDDDVDSTLIERKVLALGTKHPYLCHLFCTFQTESHLFFVMEYLNGGDLMFHIQESGRFPEERARFYGAEIISGLKFLHKKGIIYRDLKLDNVLLDFDGHVRIADFGMCKLQIYLDKTADSFCGTPDYMAPEIIKGEKYNQYVDWWSFGVLLYEMLIGQSPFSGCDEDELFWSICNEIPWFPVYISAEATSILKGLLEKDYAKRIGSQYSLAGDIADHIFFSAIDWNLLDKRQLDPPFKPQVKHPLDTQYFDRVFTRERVRLTPIDKDILQSMDQKQFHGFSYTNPHITLD